jgi:hypothetical protein
MTPATASLADGETPMTPDYTAMEGHKLHDACGVDAAKWAAAFRQYAIKLGYSDMDEGWLTGWFANPMMAMHDHVTGFKPVVLDDGSAFFVADVPTPAGLSALKEQGETP